MEKGFQFVPAGFDEIEEQQEEEDKMINLSSFDQSLSFASLMDSSVCSEDSVLTELAPAKKKKKKKKQKKKQVKLNHDQYIFTGIPPQESKKEEIKNPNEVHYKSEVVNNLFCPFNPQHRVASEKRLLTHITRCKQTAPNAKYFRQCDYNPIHYFLIDQIDDHMEKCPDRLKFKVEGAGFGEWNDGEEEVLPSEIIEDETKDATRHQKEQHQRKVREYEDWLLPYP